MAAVLNNLFGGSKSSATPVPSGDSDFADFAGAPDPTPLPLTATGDSTLGGAQASVTARPYTKWYRVHERHSLDEFYSEGIILGVIAVIVVLHLFGARMNRSKARSWIRAHAKPLASEFALVGFGSLPAIAADNASDEVLKELKNANEANPNSLLKEKSLFEFATYATGRQNVAFLDVKLTLLKRFNPITTIFEQVMGFFVESAGTPEDNLEAVIYPFDGKEALTVPGLPGAHEGKAKDSKSAFDGFVWALVSKDHMKQIRDDRYDVSLTYTKDHPKLPSWLSVMSESAEITDALLTPELIKAAQDAGDNFQYLIVSDQPVDKPKTIDETTPRKRIFLRYKLPSNNNYESLVPLFSYFIRMPDALVQSGRFRPEVLRKVKNVREEMIKQLRKADEEEKAEERAAEREKARKQKRDAELNTLDAKAQKKYLEKEREKEMRKMQKRQTTRA